MLDSKIDENTAVDFLKSFQLMPERYSKTARRSGIKTPEFKVTSHDDKFFFCEVKSIFTNIDEAGLQHSKALSIISDKMHDSMKKFSSVNRSHFVPNVLIWVTHTPMIDWHKFIEVSFGKITIPKMRDGTLILDFHKFDSYSRIKEELIMTDLSIWLFKSRPKYVFTGMNMYFVNMLARLFNLNEVVKL